MIRKLIKYIRNPLYRFQINSYFLHLYDGISDEEFIRKKFHLSFNREMDLKNPITFNEKLQFLKIYERKDIYTTMVDKYLAKDYVSDRIGTQYIIPTIGVWDNPEEIDFEMLPMKFVLKCNHNSGLGMYICRNKEELNVLDVRKKLQRGLGQNYYLESREWPYKNVKRKIIAEQYLSDESGQLIDYKVHCFDGIPKFILVCRDRFSESGLTEDFYTTEWEHMPVKRPNIPNSATSIPKPEKLDEMLILAGKLSKNIPFIRVDFYIVNQQIYFSELTFFPASGFSKFEPDEWDYTFGDYLELPNQ